MPITDFFPPYEAFPHTFLDNIADFELLVGSILIVLFTTVFGIFFKWYSTPAGRALFALFASISALFFLIVVGKFAGGDYLFRDLIRVFVYGVVPASAFWLFTTLIRNWWRGGSLLTLEQRERLLRPDRKHRRDAEKTYDESDQHL